jgi:hypothetical protein
MQTGDILTVGHGIIIQQVNAQGVMGSGIAKAIRDKWPVVWDDYRKVITTSPSDLESFSRLGTVVWSHVDDELLIASIVGQQFYGSGARFTSYDALDRALLSVRRDIDACSLQKLPIHYPLLGSDRGGAHWPVVKAILNYRLKDLLHGLWLLPGTAELS